MAIVLASWVVSAFLSHWSLLDGAPRNSLQLFLDGQADRPFAYRLLAPAVVRVVDASLPETAQSFLANQLAPVLFMRYVKPLENKYEAIVPGITARAQVDWADARYRRSYVLMVMLLVASFAGAMLLIHRAARFLGAGRLAASAVMVLYAMVTPTMFLNGGYFYDFTEQLGAAALICCVLESRWLLALLVLVLMQINKETGFLMGLFLAPYAWHSVRWRMVLPAILALLLCVTLGLFVQWAYVHLLGQPTEWHLAENLTFWSRLSSWTATEDFHSVGLVLPRMAFLYFATASLILGCWKTRGPELLAAAGAFFVLLGLLLTMGFKDEFRNLSLSLPLLLLLFVERNSEVD